MQIQFMQMASAHKNRILRLRLSSGRPIEVFAHVIFREPDSLFAELAKRQNIIDCAHRDGRLVRLLINSLRICIDEEGKVVKEFVPPEEFNEWRPLIAEAQYWRLNAVEKLVDEATITANTITVGYHGTLSTGRGGFTSDVNFRKIDRILISGRARACREVFGRHLNETRDWNMDNSRYTSRFYLIHTFLEQAFDALASNRYKLISSNCNTPRFSKNKNNDHEKTFSHYSQYVFVRYS